MKKLIVSTTATLAMTMLSGLLYAGTCEIQYTRTACDGKEDISYKKCKGKQSCSKFKEASSAQECAAMAVKSCRNKRLTVTKSKVINAIFDENKIKASNGSDDFCSDYENASVEFNKCDG